MIKNILFKFRFLLIGLALSVFSRGEAIKLYDDAFTITNTQGSNVLSGRWGIWNGTQFIQSITTGVNLGFVDLAGVEMDMYLSQTNNNVYASGTQMALAIFTDGSSDASGLNWSSASHAVVLTDISWLAPTFSFGTTEIIFNLTSATTALKGSYNYNGGNEIMSLSSVVAAIPEPAAFSFFLGFVSIGLGVFRRRGKG